MKTVCFSLSLIKGAYQIIRSLFCLHSNIHTHKPIIANNYMFQQWDSMRNPMKLDT